MYIYIHNIYVLGSSCLLSTPFRGGRALPLVQILEGHPSPWPSSLGKRSLLPATLTCIVIK